MSTSHSTVVICKQINQKKRQNDVRVNAEINADKGNTNVGNTSDEIRKTIANDMMQKTDNRGGTTQNAQIKNWYSWTVLRLMFH